MAYYKRYFDEKEITKITKKALRHWLSMAYTYVNPVIDTIDEGHVVRTRHARYANDRTLLQDPPEEKVSGWETEKQKLIEKLQDESDDVAAQLQAQCGHDATNLAGVSSGLQWAIEVLQRQETD